MDNDDDMVILSDCLDDHSYEIKKAECKNNSLHTSKRKDSEGSNLSDFEFPEVNFDDINAKNSLKSDDEKVKDLCFSDFCEVNFDNENNAGFENENNLKDKNIRKESQSDSDYDTQSTPNDYWDRCMEELKVKYQVDVNLSSDENEEVVEKNIKNNKGKEKKIATKPKKAIDEEKKRQQEERQQEKIKRQEAAAKQKAIKELNSKNRLLINPDYSMKLMEVILDEAIQNSDYFTDFLRAAEECEVKHKVQSQLVPKSITWNRKVEENYVSERHEVCSHTRIVNESHVIIIWDCEETIKYVSDDTLVSTISNIKALIPNKKLSLVIYKIENYFKYLRDLKDRAVQQEIMNGLGEGRQKKNKTKADKNLAHLPKISRKKFEECLVEIQLMYNVSTRLIENQAEMALLIYQYTKSLAVLPSKLEKRQESKMDWYINCDNRDTVKVDKDGNGLKRLWQQQLCQFNLMSLETSEAISSVYNSPLQLMEAYAKCSPAEGEKLLKDIPIRRAAGPITSVRKIGPELSKKLYLMFTSEDGEVYLNE